MTPHLRLQSWITAMASRRQVTRQKPQRLSSIRAEVLMTKPLSRYGLVLLCRQFSRFSPWVHTAKGNTKQWILADAC